MPYEPPSDLPDIVISSRDTARALLRRNFSTFRHVVSISDKTDEPPREVTKYPGRRLILNFDDVTHEDEDLTPPTKEDVRQIVEFAQKMNPLEMVLVHCNAGISRSSAAALTLLASKLDPSPENAKRALEVLLQIKEAIHPNWLMVDFADELLGYGGALSGARREAFGEGTSLLWLPVK